MIRVLLLVAALSLATACQPKETFEEQGIRLHDAAQKCTDEIATVLRATPDPKQVALKTVMDRCRPIDVANAAYIEKARKLRADGVIR